MTDKEILLESDELSSDESGDRTERALKDVVGGGSDDVTRVSIDEFLIQTGECGRYQVFIACLINLAMVPMAFPPLIFYFIGYNPPFTCNQNATHSNGTFCAQVNSSIIFEHNKKEQCSLEKSEWSFANHGRSNLVTDFNLVCDRAWLDALAGSIVFIGWGIGILTLGYLSDQHGRKKIMYPALFLTLMALMGHAFVTEIWQLIVVRFLMGFTYSGPALNNFILNLELVGPNKRVLAATFNNAVWPISAFIMTLKAYYIRNWRYLALACSIPYVLGVFTITCVPESVRWLSVKGRTKEAEKVLRKAAKFNKKESSHIRLADEDLKENKKVSYLILFKKYKLFRLMVAQAFIWFNCGMVYYALSWAFSDLGGDMFLNFVLSTLIEIPGGLLIYFMLKCAGRKKTTIFVTFLATFCCLIVACTPERLKNVRLAFGLIGKLAISAAFSGVYIWSSELYSTCVRTQGMGINIVTSRIGAATSPFIKLLHRIHPAAPFALMCFTSFLSAILCFTLPETHMKPTRETMDDMFEEGVSYKAMYSMAGKGDEKQSKSARVHLLEDVEEDEDDVNDEDGALSLAILSRGGVRT